MDKSNSRKRCEHSNEVIMMSMYHSGRRSSTELFYFSPVPVPSNVRGFISLSHMCIFDDFICTRIWRPSPCSSNTSQFQLSFNRFGPTTVSGLILVRDQVTEKGKTNTRHIKHKSVRGTELDQPGDRKYHGVGDRGRIMLRNVVSPPLGRVQGDMSSSEQGSPALYTRRGLRSKQLSAEPLEIYLVHLPSRLLPCRSSEKRSQRP